MRVPTVAAALAVVCLSAGPLAAQHDHAHPAGEDQVGKVAFANSCGPAVQDELGRAVAMLHSFWYGVGERTFRDVLAHDPGCAVATWGIAALVMNNPLAGV